MVSIRRSLRPPLRWQASTRLTCRAPTIAQHCQLGECRACRRRLAVHSDRPPIGRKASAARPGVVVKVRVTSDLNGHSRIGKALAGKGKLAPVADDGGGLPQRHQASAAIGQQQAEPGQRHHKEAIRRRLPACRRCPRLPPVLLLTIVARANPKRTKRQISLSGTH
jgi:hypothetical protein